MEPKGSRISRTLGWHCISLMAPFRGAAMMPRAPQIFTEAHHAGGESKSTLHACFGKEALTRNFESMSFAEEVVGCSGCCMVI